MTDNKCLTTIEIIDLIKAKEKPVKHLDYCPDCTKEWNYWQDILSVSSSIELSDISHIINKVTESLSDEEVASREDVVLVHDSFLSVKPRGRRTGYTPSRYLSFRNGDLRINLRLAPDNGNKMSVVVGIDPVISGALAVVENDTKTIIDFDDSGIASYIAVKTSRNLSYSVLLDSGETIELKIPPINEND